MRLFLFLILFCFTSSSLADSFSDQTVLDIDSVSESIWRVHDRSFKKSSTGFFIEPGKFVTNYHVIAGLLEDSEIGDLVLSQPYKFPSLKVEKVLALSVLYDLALLEIKVRTAEETPPPLRLGENLTNLNKDQDLVMLGYPHGQWEQINKIGEFLPSTLKQISIFPVDCHYLFGASGSPVLDNKGQVVGVVFKGNANLVQMINLPFLKRFVSGEEGQNCKNLGIKECMRQTFNNLREQAKQGDALAQYKLSSYYKERNELRKASKWLEKSAEQGYAIAQAALADLYFDLYFKREGTQAIDNWMEKTIKWALLYFTGRSYDEFQVWEWTERAAEQDAMSQYNLGVLYAMSSDSPDQRLTEEAYKWFMRSARQGYAPAREVLSYIQGKEVADINSSLLVEAIKAEATKRKESANKIPSGEDSCLRTM